MDAQKYPSELGDVEVLNSFVRRRRDDHDKWEHILDVFNEDELVDKITFSEIEDIDFEPGSSFPNIVFETGEDTVKRMFLDPEDNAEEIFDNVEYRWKVYRQNNP